MSYAADECSYCGSDAAGPMARHTIAPLLWCGVCPEGLSASFGAHTNEQLQTIIDSAADIHDKFGAPQEFIAKIDKKFGSDQIPQAAHKLYWELLRMTENAAFAQRVLDERV